VDAGPPVRQSVTARCGNFLFRYRKWVLPPVLLMLFLRYRPLLPWGSRRLDQWLDLFGIATALAGQGLRFAAIGYVYIRRGGLSGRIYADGLVTEGMFRHSRNPLYLGNILILLGLVIVFNNPWVYVIGVPFVLIVYALIVRAEEVFLLSRFGQPYADYCDKVNRWLPDLRGLSRTVEGMRFNWRRLVIKEYGSTYAWLAAAVLLLAYEARLSSSLGHERLSLAWHGAGLAVLTAGWATVRYLKKSRLLTEALPPARGRTKPAPASPGAGPLR
jgi:protein-S-isoprenylcysteine O-methyltransferase Ste14